MWRPEEDATSSHPPCPITIQFLVRSKKLEMTVVLRSSDAWMAAIPDFIAFTNIQRLVGQKLKLRPGRYTQFAVSYHVYEYDVLMAREAMQ